MSTRVVLVSAALASILFGCVMEDSETDRRVINTETQDVGDTEIADPLVWLGDTHVRVAGTYLPPTLEPSAEQNLEVYTQTYPIGAAYEVELFWSDDSYTSISSARMELDADHVGIYGSNSQWRAAVPAESLVAGQALNYWIRAEDHDGNVMWGSLDGQNYQVRPRTYAVGWVGGFGSFRPVNSEYAQGSLFNSDDSTSTGCWNHGVSLSSYRSRAVRVWIPGLTDRDFASDQELAAAVAMVQVEAYTDARVEGWGSIPARFAMRLGNDFLYRFQFVTFNPGCVIGLDDGTYAFKIRASTNAGQDWFWRGSENGPFGGDDLLVQYARRCSYFNNPYDCIPTETSLTRSLPNGNIERWPNTPIGASSTFTRELLGTSRPVTVNDIGIDGPDGDQFSVQVFDVAAAAYVDAAGPFLLEEGDELRLILVHAPTVASPGLLPQQATVTWGETHDDTRPRYRAVDGIYLRARSQ